MYYNMLTSKDLPICGTIVPNRIFVGGISGTTTETDLMRVFTAYGNVTSTKIIFDRAGISKGYGFVTFETEEEAQRLQVEGERILLRERKLTIGPAIRRQIFTMLQPSTAVFYRGAQIHQLPPQLMNSNGNMVNNGNRNVNLNAYTVNGPNVNGANVNVNANKAPPVQTLANVVSNGNLMNNMGAAMEPYGTVPYPPGVPLAEYQPVQNPGAEAAAPVMQYQPAMPQYPPYCQYYPVPMNMAPPYWPENNYPGGHPY